MVNTLLLHAYKQPSFDEDLTETLLNVEKASKHENKELDYQKGPVIAGQSLYTFGREGGSRGSSARPTALSPKAEFLG